MLFLYSIALVDIALCQWTPAGSSGVVCIHTALLPNSQVLCLERPHKDQYPINSLTGGLLSAQIDVMNTANADGSWTSKFTPIAIENNPFCGGHCQMADGSVMVIGGDNQSMVGPDNVEYVRNGRNGRRQFTPQGTAVGKWSLLPDMTSARWYPTVLTLQSGTVMIIGGNTRNLDFDFLTVEENNPTIEYWPAKPSGPFESPLLRWAFPHMMYPIAFQAPSGKVMLFVSNRTDIIDPTTDTSTQLPDLPSMDHAPWIYPHTPTGTFFSYRNDFAHDHQKQFCIYCSRLWR